MSRLTRDGTAEPVSRDQILRHARGQGNIHFPCSADHEQDWQPYPVDPYSAICDDHTYITCDGHIYIHGSTAGEVANPARGQLNGENEYFSVCPRSGLRIWSRKTRSAVPSRVSLLIFQFQA